MTSSDFSVAFHIGVHKTATTHLQRSFNLAHEALDAVGVQYFGPKYFRLPGRAIPRLFGLAEGKTPPRRTPQEQLTAMRKNGHRLVLSEENYIGVLNSPRRLAVKQRYPDAGPRLAALAQAIGLPIDVLLCVRRPTAFINSAYCQLLMGGRAMPVARYKQINPLASVDWLDLVTRLRATPGVGQLTVWRYEDYADVFPQVCAAMVGPAHAHLVQSLDRQVHRGLSAAAVAEVLRRHAEGATENLGFAMRKAFPQGPDNPAFDGYDDIGHAVADAIYDKQIAAIAALPDVTLLRPPAA